MSTATDKSLDQTETITANTGDLAVSELTQRSGDFIATSWSVSLEVLRANLTHDKNSEEAIELLIWCYLYCTAPETAMRREEFAAKVGYDHTTILKVLRGSNLHPVTRERMAIPEQLIQQMEGFKAAAIEKAAGKRAKVSMTPTLQRIWAACDLARESRSPVFIIGPSHIGKSMGLTTYAQSHNHGRTVYVRLNAASGLGGMVRLIARAIGGIGMKGNTATLIQAIKERLRINMVLILDEVHELLYTYRKESFFACMEVIREIYDAVECGLVICGTKLLMKQVVDNRGELEQLLRRGVHKVILPEQPTKGDLTVILADAGLEFPDRHMKVTVKVGGQDMVDEPYEMLRQVGKNDGLKAITERIRYGEKFASKGKAKLAWSHVIRAHLTIKQNEVPGDDWGTN